MIKRSLLRNLRNVPGWHTSRRIVVIESDDWGSIRMPSHDVFTSLHKQGLDLTSGDSYRFNSYDTLASSEDLAALFEVLCRYKDKNGNRAKFTAVSVVANPDFNKIRESDFAEFFYEPFTETLKRYYVDDSSFLLRQEGINLGIFIPQFHGREHLNVPVWLKSLRNNDIETRLAFDRGLWGFTQQTTHLKTPRYQAAFDIADVSDLDFHSSILIDGLDLFQKLFGYRAQYFVPPNGQINNSLNKIISKAGVKFRSASPIQKEPVGNGKYRKVHHYLGQKNKYGLTYITRNAVFEPSSNEKNWADSCLNDINIAFRWKRPAIINTHRVNYIGALDKSNRDHGLRQLDILLKTILKKWPDVEFLSTDQLGNIILS